MEKIVVQKNYKSIPMLQKNPFKKRNEKKRIMKEHLTGNFENFFDKQVTSPTGTSTISEDFVIEKGTVFNR